MAEILGERRHVLARLPRLAPIATAHQRPAFPLPCDRARIHRQRSIAHHHHLRLARVVGRDVTQAPGDAMIVGEQTVRAINISFRVIRRDDEAILLGIAHKEPKSRAGAIPTPSRLAARRREVARGRPRRAIVVAVGDPDGCRIGRASDDRFFRRRAGAARESQPKPSVRRILHDARIATKIVAEIGHDLQRFPRLTKVETPPQGDINIACRFALRYARLGKRQQRLVRRSPNRRDAKDQVARITRLERDGVEQRLALGKQMRNQSKDDECQQNGSRNATAQQRGEKSHT